jgi:hypothetical protein
MFSENPMKRFAIVFFVIVAVIDAQATHLRCGYISLKKVSGLTYTVKLTVYTDLRSPVRFSDGTLTFGDGTTHTTTTVENTVLSGYNGVGIVEYSVDHTFPANNTYTISYSEANLKAGILNMNNSVSTRFYIQLKSNLNSEEDSSTPEFLTHPILENTIKQSYAFSNAAFDNKGSYFRYQLGLVYQANGIVVGNLRIPKSLLVNYYNGLVTWDNLLNEELPFPYLGDYLFSLDIYQYNANGKLINVIQRTFQIILNDSDSMIKITGSPADKNGKIFVESGKSKTVKLVLESEGTKRWELNHDPKIAANLSFEQYDSTLNSKQVRVAAIKLNSTPQIIRDEPYSITIRAKATNSLGYVNQKDVVFLFFTKDIELPIVNVELPTIPVVTGLEDKEIDEIQIYPNPFSSYFKLTLTSGIANDSEKVKIFDSSGKLVTESKLNSDEQFDTSNLATGFYILQVDNKKVRAIKK